MNKQEMVLKYNYPAPIDNEFARSAVGSNSWEKYSLPLGNGYFGANFFGRTKTERIQISEPTLVNPWYLRKNNEYIGCPAAGVNSFLEILINFNHDNVSNYERKLSLEDACYSMHYDFNEVHYNMTAFTSHVDKVLVVKIESNQEKSISFDMECFIPFIGKDTKEEGDSLSKDGHVTINDNMFIIEGSMSYYDIKYMGLLKVNQVGGTLTSTNDKISISNADYVEILFTCGSNYQLSEHIFSENNPKDKLKGLTVDVEELYKTIDDASKLGFDELKNRHIKDYSSLYSRAGINIEENYPNKYTNEIINDYRSGKKSRYLETLLFQYGRYLLISSSRTALPAHLQGIWNPYCDSPWSCGYWHNINIQMNYWLSAVTNLNELFVPYINYAKAFMDKTRTFADLFMKNNYPDKYDGEHNNGWIIGTGCSAYHVEAFDKVYHSGPGTGAFTALMFWDYFDYTLDIEFLKDFGYQALYEMSLFYSKILVEIDGKYLIKESASPENEHNGTYYKTVGCAFDQQMVYEVFKRTIEAAQVLNINDDLIAKISDMLPNLDPVLIGDSGQIKEYREETTYGSIGDPHHRHVAQLSGLYPGTSITHDKPEWIEGARISLQGRGNVSGDCNGWALIYRWLFWTRIKDPKECEELIKMSIDNMFENLWFEAPPFQIDANFGYTTAICEMLMQCQNGYIELLPCTLDSWRDGEFYGLLARGNFTIDCKWKDGKVTYIKIISNSNGILKIKLPLNLNYENTDIYSKKMNKGEVLIFE